MVYNPLKVGYRKSPPFIISVPLTDLIAGKGIVKLYAGDGEGGVYTLSSQQFYSHDGVTGGTGGGAGSIWDVNNTLDVDFDALVGEPLTVQGDAVAQIGLTLFRGSGNVGSTITCAVSHFDGSTETELATDSVILEGNPKQYYLISFVLPITTAKKFVKGDSIRFTVKGTVILGTGGNGQLGHDPFGRDTNLTGQAFITTDLSSATQLLLPILIPR